MAFQALELSIQVIGQLRPAVVRIRARDRKLAAQITDAMNSVALNLGEGEFSDPGNRRARYHSAAGSASEVRAGLRAARAWGYLSEAQAQSTLLELDRLLAMLWKLTR